MHPVLKSVKYHKFHEIFRLGNCAFREELFGTDPQLPCTKVIVNEGQAILMPGGTPHMVHTPISLVARGSNFIWECQLS